MNKFPSHFFKLNPCSRHRFLAVLSLLWLLPAVCAADSIEKVIINADHMRLNIESGNSEYTGNVRISQGALVLSGDKVTLEQKNNEIERITVTGKPARYNHVTEKGENITAESENMVYNASQNKLVMTINAKLQQPDHQVSSQRIIYDTLKKIIIAGDKSDGSAGAPVASGSDGTKAGDGSGQQRVNITLTPKKQLLPPEEEPTKE